MAAAFAGSGTGSASLDSFTARHPLLEEEPSDDAQRKRLVDELKARGNGAFKARSMREALVLYTRAIELAPEVAALRGNSSMVRLALGEFEQALADAEEAIRIDGAWNKGYYRKALALEKLGRFEDAAWAMEEAIRKTDSEKAKKPMQKQVLELQKQAANATTAAPEAEDKVAEDRFMKGGQAGGFGVGAMGSTTAGLNAAGAAAVQKAGAGAKPKPKGPSPPPASITSTAAPKPNGGGGGGGDMHNDMRGYKTLADGRKTSFFHMEISEEAKRLQAEQGSFVHGKKISADEASQYEASVEGGVSVWNSSGTPEEKDMMKWAKERLQTLLCTMPDGAPASFVKVHDVDGDALFTFRKGKKGRIFDLGFVVDYVAGETKGKLTVTNFSNDCGTSDGDEYEVQASPTIPSTYQVGLRSHLKQSLETWFTEFNEM